MRVHKVGTVTLGLTLVVIGILFLAELFFPTLPGRIICIIWPVIFIILGGEVLWGNHISTNQDFVYDKTAIVLVVILTFFAMFLAIIGNLIQYRY